MGHLRYNVACPGCGRRISGLSEDARRARVLVHIRNCPAMKQMTGALVPLGELRQPEESTP